jgi:competence protein ComGC
VNKDEGATEAEAFKPPPKMDFQQFPQQQPQPQPQPQQQQLQQQQLPKPAEDGPPAMIPQMVNTQAPALSMNPTMNPTEFSHLQQNGTLQAPNPEPPSQNMFKMQKGRSKLNTNL